MSIKSILIPRKHKAWLFHLRESYLDAKRYLRAAEFPNEGKRKCRKHLESEIIRRYHVIEKGLSMPEFRPRFGAEMVCKLVECLEDWDLNQKKDGYQCEESQVKAAKAVLFSYFDRHRALGIDVSDIVPARYSMENLQEVGISGGVKPIDSISPETAISFEQVVLTRVSVRDFEVGRLPDRDVITSAVGLAIQTPSVCNRQTWRVHIFEGKRAQEILSLQNGNRGFGHTIPTVIVVTSDMRYFSGTIERYQAWVDGGMFAMALLLALHSKGLGSVALNWCVLNKRDMELRSKGRIPDYERIIMLIGCGYPRLDAVVPHSQRRSKDSIIHWDSENK